MEEAQAFLCRLFWIKPHCPLSFPNIFLSISFLCEAGKARLCKLTGEGVVKPNETTGKSVGLFQYISFTV